MTEPMRAQYIQFDGIWRPEPSLTGESWIVVRYSRSQRGGARHVYGVGLGSERETLFYPTEQEAQEQADKLYAATGVRK